MSFKHATLDDVLAWRGVEDRPRVEHARVWGPVLEASAAASGCISPWLEPVPTVAVGIPVAVNVVHIDDGLPRDPPFPVGVLVSPSPWRALLYSMEEVD